MLVLPARLGPYELLEKLGQGGMAAVYRAYQASVERHVAVKIIHKNIAGDPQALERFRREARLIARLEHPHIVPVYDFDGTSDPPYLVMRYMDSGTLKEVLVNQRLPLMEVGYLLKQIAAAVDYAHRQGIIHRDIKPSNIMLDQEGNPFVSDFGIARIISDGQMAEQRARTQTGLTMGTPDYMAPEQVLGNADVDARADVYALSVMAFQLLTGQLPFTADIPMLVMMKHLQELPPRASEFNPELPNAVDAVLLKALAKEPSARWVSAGEFVGALMGALGEIPLEAPQQLRQAAQRPNPEATTRIFTDLRPQPTTPTEQNRVVTAVHVNAAEYATLAEDPRLALHALWQAAAQIVRHYQGRIFTQTADSLTALWGAEATHEDDPVNALRAALEIQATLRRLGAGQFEETAEAPLPLKIGAHTGLAIIGTSNQAEASLTASGATLSLASRLAEKAEGTLLISHHTFRLVFGRFSLEPGEALRMRGRAGAKPPLATYRVTAIKPRALRLTLQRVEGIETKLIGRETELKRLQEAFLSAVEDHETQGVCVTGPAGIGKSRLLLEFLNWAELRPEQFRLFQGRATPETQGHPYAFLRELLTFNTEVQESDSPTVIREKLEQTVARILGTPTAPETAHFLGYLLGYSLDESPHIQGLLGDPAQLTRLGRQAFVRLITHATQGQIMVVLMLLEDLQYADKASLEVLAELFKLHRNLPLVWVATGRTLAPNLLTAQRLELPLLSKREARLLAREVLQKMPDPPKALTDWLAERSEGNPLYLEELIKALVEDRVIRKRAAQWTLEAERLTGWRRVVPPTLAGLLQARLDGLLAPERVVLQRAAVMGRIFWEGAVVALGQMDAANITHISEVLYTLAEREFIYRHESSAFAESREYAFAQSLLRDVAYNSLTKRQQQAYHAGVAAWLIQAGGDRAAEYALLIAEHWEKAGEVAQAAAYLEQAGDQAMRLSAFAEARNFYARAQASQSPSAHLPWKLADAHYRLSDFVAARGALQAALNTTLDPVARATTLALLGELGSETGHYEAASATLGEALAVARDVGDTAVLARVLYGLGDVNWRQGHLGIARAYLEESIELARALNDPTRLLYALNRLGGVYLQIDLDEAERLWREVHSRASAVGNRERAMAALNNLGEVAKARGDVAQARALYPQALALAREIGAQQVIALLLLNLADADIQLGQLANVRAGLREGLTLARELGALPWVLWAVGCFAELAHAEGHIPRALALWGMVQRHPAFSSDLRRRMEPMLAQWGLDAATLATGLAEGVALDFETTVAELLRT